MRFGVVLIQSILTTQQMSQSQLIDEIKRRKQLIGTKEGDKNGNRLRILDTKSAPNGQFSNGIQWDLLAPTPEEADIPKGDEEDDHPSSNPSSLVIRWSIQIDGRDNLVLLGGDSTVDIWERILEDNREGSSGRMSWNILSLPTPYIALHPR